MTPDPQLSGLAGWAGDVVASLGEVGLGLLVALENVFPPIPSEPVLALAGVLAAQGTLSLTLLVIASTLGSVLGALVFYGLGARVGRPRVVRILERIPLVDVRDLERTEAWFSRHGDAAVLVGRLVPVVRSFVSIPAGFTRVPLLRFMLLTAIGSGLWNTAFVMAGYLAGTAVDLGTLGRFLDYGTYVAAAVLVVVATRRFLRNRRDRQDGARDRHLD